jgi:hypothetical protein
MLQKSMGASALAGIMDAGYGRHREGLTMLEDSDIVFAAPPCRFNLNIKHL